MTLTTYEALRAAIADWLERSDLASRTADFVALAEARLNRSLNLAVMEGEIELILPAGAEAIDLPADCREALGLWRVGADGERKALRYRTPLMLPRASGAGAPRFWTLEGEAIVLERPCAEETALILRRVVRLGLSEAEPTNPVLAEHPDLYLFGALAEAAPYLRDSEMAALFLGRFEMALGEARAADSRRHGRARLVCEPAALAKAVPC